MTYYPVQSPYPIFTDEDGTPLEDGYIYIGEAYQNPITNPITASWDTSGLYPAAQPIRTIGGYPDRNGSPGIIYVNAGAFEDYSILVQDKHGNQIYFEQSARSAMGGYGGNSLDIINDLRSISGYDQPIYVRAHSMIGDGGGGNFEWTDGAAPGTYTDDDGITIVPTGGDGSGAWVRQYDDNIIDLLWYNPTGDGTTDDTAIFAAALAVGSPVRIPKNTNGYRADIDVTTNDVLICDDCTIYGTMDYTDVQYASLLGKVTIIPIAGSSWAMKWRKTRYCFFNEIYIGETLVVGTHPGKGLLIEGAVGEGTYYNIINKLTVVGMDDIGLHLVTDNTDSIFRVGTNQFVNCTIDYCADGVHLEGSSNNIFNNLSIEQCEGTILKIRQAAATIFSNGNKFFALYTENPTLTTWIDTETTARGTFINLTNEADGSDPPTNFINANGSFWQSRGELHIGLTGQICHGPIVVADNSVDILTSYGDAEPKMRLSGSNISTGLGGASATDSVVGRQDVSLWGSDNTTWLRAGNGAWDGAGLRMGSYRLWVDATGALRIKSGAPASDLDGTVVGTQT